jgi:hypothetical protein
MSRSNYSPLSAYVSWVFYISLYGILASLVTGILVPITLGFILVVWGPTVGLAIGLAEMRWLRQYLPSRNWARWALFSLYGAIGGWFTLLLIWAAAIFVLGFGGPSVPMLAAIFAVNGALFGLVQAWEIDKLIFRAIWVCTNAVGLIAGGMLSKVVSTPIYTNIIPWHASYFFVGLGEGLAAVMIGTIMTLVFAAVTGTTSVLLLKRLYPTSSNPPMSSPLSPL